MARECFKLPADTNQESIKMVVANAYCNPQHNCQSVQLLDFKMKELLNTFGEQITKCCFSFRPSFTCFCVFFKQNLVTGFASILPTF